MIGTLGRSSYMSRTPNRDWIWLTPDGKKPKPTPQLTAKQREVMDLVCQGLTDKEIARIIGIKPESVRAHRMGAYKKLGARNGAHAVWNLNWGLHLNDLTSDTDQFKHSHIGKM